MSTVSNSSVQRLERLKNYLATGRKITGSQAASRFGITKLSRAAQTLQNQGVPVYRNFTKNADGRRVAQYHMSVAAPNIIRAGFVAYRLARTNPEVAAALNTATSNAKRASRAR